MIRDTAVVVPPGDIWDGGAENLTAIYTGNGKRIWWGHLTGEGVDALLAVDRTARVSASGPAEGIPAHRWSDADLPADVDVTDSWRTVGAVR